MMELQQAIRIFVIDGDQALTMALRSELERTFPEHNLQISCFGSVGGARAYFSGKPHLLLIDDRALNENNKFMNGAGFMTLIRKESPDTEVILLTDEEHAGTAERVLECGAYDYIVRNDYIFRKLNLSVAQYLKLHSLKNDMQKQQFRNRMLVLSVSLITGTLIALWLWLPAFPPR